MAYFWKISNVGHFQYALYRICNASMTLIIFCCRVLGEVVSKKLCLLNYATSYYFFQPFSFPLTKPKIKNTPKIWHVFQKSQMWVISNMLFIRLKIYQEAFFVVLFRGKNTIVRCFEKIWDLEFSKFFFHKIKNSPKKRFFLLFCIFIFFHPCAKNFKMKKKTLPGGEITFLTHPDYYILNKIIKI